VQDTQGERRRIISLAAAATAVRELISTLARVWGWEPGRLHLFGFSQVGTVALEVARRPGVRASLGSCIAVAGGLLPEVLGRGLPPPGAAPSSTQVLITRGSADDTLTADTVERTTAALRGWHTMDVSVQTVPNKGHSMPQGEAEMRVIFEFWSRRLRNRPSDGAGPGGPGELIEIGGQGGGSLERV
jgi:predicted esterase